MRVKYPIIKFISDTADLYKQRTLQQANNVRELIFRGCVIALIIALLVWLSILMYIAFYYAYVPYVSHSKPVHVTFKPCSVVCTKSEYSRKSGVCSFPSAHVQLTKRNQLLMMGQPYKVEITLEMPESEANKELGMFMVCADFRTKAGELVHTSCRSAMLQYNSPLLDTLRTIVLSPGLILGATKQKQNIQIELFSDYEDDQERPVTDVYIEIQSQNIELYSATLLISAHFSGLRYMMFHWPILSASIGITSNLFFIAFISILSWYQLINSEEYLNYKHVVEHTQKFMAIKQKKFSDDSPSIESTQEIESDIKFETQESSSEDIREFVDILSSEKISSF
ncbi:seipin [Chrysoperla carnea]|uniref:seipin n=1 Tax=Chrysoperla carnea TaxID=189513 RepID=UPI001D080EDD|nr:seipin [Chrysoperla carnea]